MIGPPNDILYELVSPRRNISIDKFPFLLAKVANSKEFVDNHPSTCAF